MVAGETIGAGQQNIVALVAMGTHEFVVPTPTCSEEQCKAGLAERKNLKRSENAEIPEQSTATAQIRPSKLA